MSPGSRGSQPPLARRDLLLQSILTCPPGTTRHTHGRLVRHLAAIVLLLPLAAAACTPEANRGTSSYAPEIAATSQPVSGTPTPVPMQVTEARSIVGLWTAIDGSLHLQFFSDGRFARHYGGREDDPDELWSEQGRYVLGKDDHLMIDVPRRGPVDYQYVHSEPWLMLRNPEGNVLRCRRDLGLMETTRSSAETQRDG
jgi:hypothetical protein